MGSVVKGVASLFGGKKRREEQKIANAGLKDQMAVQDSVKYKNNWNDMDALDYKVVEGQAGTLGNPAQMMGANKLGRAEEADLATLADAQGYEDRLQTYTGNDYSAANTSVGGLQRGANTGLTNTFNNLQVSTAGAEMAAQEADQSLAASQDLELRQLITQCSLMLIQLIKLLVSQLNLKMILLRHLLLLKMQ